MIMTTPSPLHGSQSVWLVSEGRVLASARRVTSRADRRRGLLGVREVSEPLILDPCTWVHTVGMKTAIDVVHVSNDGVIVATAHMRPWRVGPWIRHSQFVIEAAPGSIDRWNVKLGDTVEIRDVIE